MCICIYVLWLNTEITYDGFENTQNSFKYDDINSGYNYPFILEKVISNEQAENIINYSKNKLIDSLVMSGKMDAIRNSKQTWINKNDPLVKSFIEYLSKMFNIPFENAEDPQIVRYLPNQFYKDHHDSCCDNVEQCKEFIKRGGQRILTVLIYLNDNFKGGETDFKNLNFKIKSKTGDALIFYPLGKEGKYCHPKALHAGLPVLEGEKWIANVWFRERKFI